jgi:predicted transcriptional regulator
MSNITIANLNLENSDSLTQVLHGQERSIRGGTLYIFKDGYVNVPQDGVVLALILTGYDRKAFIETLREIGYGVSDQ